MTIPPVVGSEPSRRNYFGWFAFSVLFLLSLASTLMGQSDSKREERASLVNEQAEFKQVMQRRYTPSNLLKDDSGKDKGKVNRTTTENDKLQKIVDGLKPYVQTDDIAAMVNAAALTEMNKVVGKQDLKHLLASSNPDVRAIGEIYLSKTLSKAHAQTLAKETRGFGFVGKVASVHAMRKAGIENAEKLLSNDSLAAKGFLTALIVMVVLVGSMVCWIVVGSAYASKQLVPFGLPSLPGSMLEADRFAIRAAQIFGLFIVLSLVVALGAKKLSVDPSAAQIIEAFGFFALIALLMRQQVEGKVVSLKLIGVSSENLLRNIGIGFVVFFMQLPVSLFMGWVGTKLFFWLPEPQHPAQTELLSSTSPVAIFALLMSAVIVAPVWEEIMFRGLLFPAISKVSGRVVTGAILSSFIFASIHPQNAGAWLGLGCVAIASCASMYYTKSLVPSIVMHAAHNGTLMLVTLLLR